MYDYIPQNLPQPGSDDRAALRGPRLLHSSRGSGNTVAVGLLVAALAIGGVSGCTDSLKGYVRDRDFRNVRAQQNAVAPPASSPVPNVPDMPGWTSDLQQATTYAMENGRRTIVFVQAAGASGNSRAKSALGSARVAEAAGDIPRVTFDAANPPALAVNLGLTANAPALLVLDPSGNVIRRSAPPPNVNAAVAALR